MQISPDPAAIHGAHGTHAREIRSVIVKLVRPSFLDLRFTGDPWIEDSGEGTFDLCLGNYRLTSIQGSAIDLPLLNDFLDTARHRRPRWSF